MASESGSPDHPETFLPPRGEGQPGQLNQAEMKLQLTREEIRALKECNKESFWYRCVPFSIALAAATHLAVQRGILKGHPTRGALGKNLAAIGLGYILGKWSYQGVCRDKILALENSRLADALRRQKQDKRGGSFTDVVSEMAFPDTTSTAATTLASDDYQNTEIHTDSNVTYKGLDDSMRPNIDSDTGDSQQKFQSSDKQQSYTSYEDLRKKNREEYVIKTTSSRTSQPNRPVMPRPPDVSPQPAPPTGYASSGSRPRRTTKNQYGDVWED